MERGAVKTYHKKIISMFMIVGGSSLLLEHLFTWGGFDLLDFWGHEYLGIGMVIIGFLISIKYEQKKELNLKDPRTWIR